MENPSNVIAVVLALVLLLLPFAFMFTLFLWWRSSRQLKRVAGQLAEKVNLAERALAAGKALLENNKTLKDRVGYLEGRFGDLMDLDGERQMLQEQVTAQNGEIAELRSNYAEKKLVYDRLLSELAIFDERLAFAEMGIYEPHFDFTDSEQFKSAINSIKDEQKGTISAENAVICTTNWTVDGSLSKGQTMIKRNIRLTLRAFNNECDAAIANARWNNVNAMEKRIVRARDQIDKHNTSNAIVITDEFLKLKLTELFLTHEYREKQKAERDERAELARAAREEQKLMRDLEIAQQEEERYERLLAKAKAEAAKVAGPQLEAFGEQIRTLERDLSEAHAKAERAQAMAERTKSGYVYIISNIGSFGENVIKIGLTRRLDPMDRVKELGDASVPFTFDVHAIVYSEDAPALERALHSEFEQVRVNAQNYRKEFFRVALAEVEAALKRVSPEAPFFRDIEAQEYHETLARRRNELGQSKQLEESAFPAVL
ncbi:DUF4041 domain-containing protein [Mesorhizobium sp. Z1-4]|uniref:DUF4041 domain-containing protein n=1 Tax=Mesorhizobium sp. Z1-4 TaxID=2448478 RepID=UPI001FE1301C|nr:DUF4041 domain-containing protein [Mesorhizobium sp. Z1-4]